MRQKVSFIVIIVILFNIIFFPKTKNERKDEAVTLPEAFTVEIIGEVAFPGVYEFHEAVTLNQVLQYAGGFLISANIEQVNLSESISSNKRIEINKKIINDNTIIKKDLNKITYQELLLINDVSSRIAINILLYREANGVFKYVDDLLQVKYIGEKTFEKISKYFKV